jgi:hypothetical protein
MQGASRAMSQISGEPGVAFIAAYYAGRLDEAIASLAAQKSVTGETHLLLYIAAKQKKDADLASRQLAAAAEVYRKGDRDDRRIAGWLASPTPPDPDQVCEVEILPNSKRILLTAMGLRDPAHRDQYFRAASRFNYLRTFPYWTLKRVTDKASNP